MSNRYPALHNAMWPGLVGKGPDSEPPIDLETMLELTAAAEVDGAKFEGVDLFLSLPHTDIDSTDDDLKALADKLAGEESAGRVAGGAGVAADRRRFRHGHGERARGVSDAGEKGLPHRPQTARPGDPAIRRDPHRFAPAARRNGRRIRRATRR